jgi:hypothetical protein
VFQLFLGVHAVELPKKENTQQGAGDEENERLNLKIGDVSAKGERHKTRRDNAQESDSPNPGAEARQLPLEIAELRGEREKQNDDCASYQPNPRGAGCQMHVVLLSSLKGAGHTQHSVKLLGLGGCWSKARTPPALDVRAGYVCGRFPDGGGVLGFTAQAH